MKLLELAGIKQFRTLKPEDAVERLTREHAIKRTSLKLLGNGANAVALTDGTNVYKFWREDSAYEKFINFCLRHDSDFLPKFKSKIKVIPKLLKAQGKPIDIKYIKMELLSPMKSGDFMPIWLDPAIAKHVETFKNRAWFEVIFDCSEGNTPAKALEKLLTKVVPATPDFQPLEYIEQVNPALKELIGIACGLAELLDTYDRFDYHLANMALRGKQPVILDPIVNEQDLDINDQLLRLYKVYERNSDRY